MLVVYRRHCRPHHYSLTWPISIKDGGETYPNMYCAKGSAEHVFTECAAYNDCVWLVPGTWSDN